MSMRQKIIFFSCLVVVAAAAFFSGWSWPKAAPALTLTQQPTGQSLDLQIKGSNLEGSVPKDSTLMLDKQVQKSATDFSVPITESLPIEWWGPGFAVTLNLADLDVVASDIVASQDTTTNESTQDVSTTKPFVASKSGTKYHPTQDCHFVDRIKPENRIYFESAKEAEAAGYEPSSCIK